MSVYTLIDAAQLRAFLQYYRLGELIAFSGIENGIENTNYRIQTNRGHYVLTLFEELEDAQIRPIFNLLEALGRQALPVPAPLSDSQGRKLIKLGPKSAALFNRLPGASIFNPTRQHCYRIGRLLAQLHIASRHSGFHRRNPRDLKACRTLFYACKEHLSRQERDKISAELAYQQCYDDAEIPRGVIHADLFRDNVLFVGNKISAVLDFYGSCNDFLLYDIAIVINDWCREQASVCADRTASLLSGYQSLRPLEPLESQLLPVFLRRAALRFWLSRLAHRIEGRSGSITQQKDPGEFRRILEQHSTLEPAVAAMF
ncbi:homoserine kinase [Methylomarinum vadi]|uniref:homoserine kinase n=1 Tax=Methylomarinum vadi TaxID=438855 RepID=UPI0004DFA290|nr:homoserine kinase [Methylomarinum vadi]